MSSLRLPSVLRALGHTNYQLYFAGQLVSLTGTWMQSTAQQWLVYRLTDSPLALGTVTFLAALPSMLFSLFVGVLIDRVDKRRLLMLTQTGMMILALTLAGLTATGWVRYWQVLVLALLLGLINTVDMPTRQAFTVEMVGKDDLMNAIALNSSMFNLARLAGPAVAGLLVARVGEAMAFALNGLSFVAMLAGLARMQLPPFQPRPGRMRPAADFKEGLTYIAQHRTLLALMGLAAVPSIFGFPYTTLIPVMAKEVLNLQADGFGALVSAIGLGALLGAVSLAVLGSHRHKGRLLMTATLVFASAIAAFALSRNLAFSMAALALAGWGMVSHLATTNTLVQLLVPDTLRGRVMSIYLWAVVGMAPIGSLILGSLAEAWGAPRAILLGAVVCAISAGLAWIALPQVRQLE